MVFRTGTGDCEVSETSKSCSACRFEKCLQVGMKRELLQVGDLRLLSIIISCIFQGKRNNSKKLHVSPRVKKVCKKGSKAKRLRKLSILPKFPQFEYEQLPVATKSEPVRVKQEDCGLAYVKTSVIRHAPALTHGDANRSSAVLTTVSASSASVSVIVTDSRQSPTPSSVNIQCKVEESDDELDKTKILQNLHPQLQPKIQKQIFHEAQSLLATNSFDKIFDDIYNNGFPRTVNVLLL